MGVRRLVRILGSIGPNCSFARSARLVGGGIFSSLTVVRLITRLSSRFSIRVATRSVIPRGFRSMGSVCGVVGELRSRSWLGRLCLVYIFCYLFQRGLSTLRDYTRGNGIIYSTY